jgi:hypothetical protein
MGEVSWEKGKYAPSAALPVNGVVGREGGFGRPGIGMGAEGAKKATVAMEGYVLLSGISSVGGARSRRAGGR